MSVYLTIPIDKITEELIAQGWSNTTIAELTGYVSRAETGALEAEAFKNQAEDARDVITGMTVATGASGTSALWDNTTGTLTIPRGDKGNSIYQVSSTKVGKTTTVTIKTEGLADYTFTVEDGADGVDGDDGRGITSVVFTSTTDVSGLAGKSGATDTYTITYSDATTSTFIVKNGNDGLGTVTSVAGRTGAVTLTTADLVGYTVDATPTDGSNNPVSSDGVFEALAGKVSNTGTKTINGETTLTDQLIITATENSATLGAELLTNGTFTGNATGWTLGTNWAYSNNAVVLTVNGSVEGTLSQNVSVVTDSYYVLEWKQTHSVATNAQLTPSLGAVVGSKHSSSEALTVQTYQNIFRATATGSVALTFTVNDITSTGTITIDSISLKQITPMKASMVLPSTVAGERKIEIRTQWNGVNSPNIGIGWRSLQANTTGYNNTANGVSSLSSNTTGYNNTANGGSSLLNNTTGYYNTANGVSSLLNNTTGYNNTANGVNSLLNNTTGYNNTANGGSALQNNTTGYNNTANGISSLLNNTTGYYNTANGVSSLSSNTTGYYNTANGVSAGDNNVNGNNNTFLGFEARGATASSNNTITLGNSSVTTLRCQTQTITSLSDARDKKDIEIIPLGIDFVTTLKPVKFVWNMRDGAKVGVEDCGFIAQDFKKAQEDACAKDYLQLVLEDNPEKLEISYGRLMPVVIKALQELKEENEKLAKRVAELEAK